MPIVFSNIVEKNGKTIRENNLEIQHKIGLGSIVTVDFDHNCDANGIGYQGKATLYVVKHTRDCDGTPLYILASIPVAPPSQSDSDFFRWKILASFYLNGYSEESLQDTGNDALVFYNNILDYLA